MFWKCLRAPKHRHRAEIIRDWSIATDRAFPLADIHYRSTSRPGHSRYESRTGGARFYTLQPWLLCCVMLYGITIDSWFTQINVVIGQFNFIIQLRLIKSRYLLSPRLNLVLTEFLVSNKRYGKNKTFYSSAMALILSQLKDITNFVLKLSSSVYDCHKSLG